MTMEDWNGLRVHSGDDCSGVCPVHQPLNHHMIDWPLHWRSDRGILERICKHGVGHPDPSDSASRKKRGLPDSEGVHGCDGCCQDISEIRECNV